MRMTSQITVKVFPDVAGENGYYIWWMMKMKKNYPNIFPSLISKSKFTMRPFSSLLSKCKTEKHVCHTVTLNILGHRVLVVTKWTAPFSKSSRCFWQGFPRNSDWWKWTIGMDCPYLGYVAIYQEVQTTRLCSYYNGLSRDMSL